MTAARTLPPLHPLWRGKLIFYIWTVAGLIADLGSKNWAEAAVRPDGYQPGNPTPVIPLIDGVFAWKWAVNHGAAFSMLSGNTLLLTLVGLFALGVMLLYVYRAEITERLLLVGLGLVASGAIGNLWDRIRFGWVRDFMYFDFALPGHDTLPFIPQRYPVFNVADIAILVGAVLVVIASSKKPPAPST